MSALAMCWGRLKNRPRARSLPTALERRHNPLRLPRHPRLGSPSQGSPRHRNLLLLNQRRRNLKSRRKRGVSRRGRFPRHQRAAWRGRKAWTCLRSRWLAPPRALRVRMPRSLPAPQNPQRQEERIRMSRRRMTIAQRLVEAQHTAAMLTTFNEIDMSAVVELRKRQKDAFREKYGVNLGITSFFVKACIAALKEFPHLNAEI